MFIHPLFQDENNNSKADQLIRLPALQPVPTSSTAGSGNASKAAPQPEPSTSTARPGNASSSSKKTAKVLSCTSCSYTSRSRGNMHRHKNAVHKRKTFKCEKCPKTFAVKYDMEQHRKSIHDEIQLMCEVCSKNFNNRFTLRRHRMMFHSDQAKFSCALCNKKYFEKAAYLGHINSHMEVKPYSCPACKKEFSHKYSMTRHIKTCGPQDNMRQCEQCDKQFKSMNSLKAHRKGVHGEKVLLCACGASFSWKNSFNRHKKTCQQWVKLLLNSAYGHLHSLTSVLFSCVFVAVNVFIINGFNPHIWGIVFW